MLKMVKDEVAIIPIFESEKIGSIIKPDQSRGRCKQGIIKYIGSEVKDVKIGDYVFFSGYAGTVFKLEGEGTLIFMPEGNIISVLSERVTEIDGLFFYGGDGKYFKATFEQAMILIARAMDKFYLPITDPQDRWNEKRKSKVEPTGRLFVIKEQEHEQSDNCFCRPIAREFNRGDCPRCRKRLHYYSNALNEIKMYHCEDVKCQWNTKDNLITGDKVNVFTRWWENRKSS